MELKRELKSCLRHTCKVVELSFFLGLLSITVFFAKDVWKEYISNSTSVKTQFEAKEALDLPVIVMCFNPSIKQSVIDKYHSSVSSINHEFNTTIYNEGTYHIGEDFNLTFYPSSKTTSIKKMYTAYSALCYKISPNMKLKLMDRFFLYVNMRKHLIQMPGVVFYFTSDQNSYNVMDDTVVGNILSVETKSTGFHTVLLQTSSYKRLPSMSDCDPENTIPMEYISKR